MPGNRTKFLRRLLAARLLIWRFARSGRVRHAQDVACLILSRNRPMQLEALLRSMAKRVQGAGPIYLLWTADKDYDPAYREVIGLWRPEKLKATRETNFRRDLRSILAGIKTRGILFLVDDLLFVGRFDFSMFVGRDLRREIPSLRLGRRIRFCQPSGMESPPPPFEKARGGWLGFSWRKAVGDWAMPLALDGNLLDRREIAWLCERLQFEAPNSLEEALGSVRYLFRGHRGLCLPEPVLLNFAFNRVQRENEKFPCGETDARSMLQKWNEGWRLDIEALSKIAAESCHVVVEPVFERRPE